MSRYSLAGYASSPNCRPGSQVDFHVSSDSPTLARASIVRLIHGDPNPAGPGFKQEVVVDLPGETEVSRQRTQAGGHVVVGPANWGGETRLTIHAFVWPTMVHEVEPQVLVSWWDPERSVGWSFEMLGGSLAVRIGAEEECLLVSTGRLFSHTWYSVSLDLDFDRGVATLEQHLVQGRVNSRYSPVVDLETSHFWEGNFTGRLVADAVPEVVLAARASATGPDSSGGTVAHLNGKLDSPAVFAGGASPEQRHELIAGRTAGLRCLAAWDFSVGITRQGFTDDSLVVDISGNELHGRTMNYPDRAMTGRNWCGDEEHFVHAPDQYGAIWFHADAVEDCRWQPTWTWTVPNDLPSGCYALWVRAGELEDHVPFFVTPGRRTANRIAVLIPTFSYVAYANTVAMQTSGGAQLVMGIIATLDDVDLHISEHLDDYGRSVYTHTRDGKGTQFSSWRRPIMDMRPRHRHEYGSHWQFPADLYLIDWLTEQGFEFDVITDHDLHEQGAELLSRYNVVITGTHPEYVSGAMLDAWEDYLGSGGRGMYLGGNGFYWVTTPHPDKPWLIEMRRGEVGDQGWRAEAGERYHQINGERGGLWRMRGRAPQRLWGVGYGAHGLDRSAPYVQLPDASDARWSWIFEGVAAGEAVGNFGLSNNGAAGLEFDRIDSTLGTPPNTALLASSIGHSRNAAIAVEDVYLARDGMNGIESPLVRSDLAFFTTRGGGAVFSAGSMTWCGSLAHNDYSNNVSTITRNILAVFAGDAPLAPIQ